MKCLGGFRDFDILDRNLIQLQFWHKALVLRCRQGHQLSKRSAPKMRELCIAIILDSYSTFCGDHTLTYHFVDRTFLDWTHVVYLSRTWWHSMTNKSWYWRQGRPVGPSSRDLERVSVCAPFRNCQNKRIARRHSSIPGVVPGIPKPFNSKPSKLNGKSHQFYNLFLLSVKKTVPLLHQAPQCHLCLRRAQWRARKTGGSD